MEVITTEMLPALFEAVAEQFSAHADLLCEMDSKMGDGDLGLTMRKGFGGLPDILRGMEETDLSRMLRKAGIEMTDLVPSTMGMLMGTGISYGGKALTDKTELDAEGLVLFLKGFAEGIQKRGKCARGDCTVLDCIGQAAEEAEAVFLKEGDRNLKKVCQAALRGAEKGVEATKEMLPKYGKAAVHQGASRGTADQGAVAGMVMVRGFADYIVGE